MPLRFLHGTDLLFGAWAILSTVVSNFLMAVSVGNPEDIEQLKVLLVPLLGATFAGIGMVMLRLGHESRKQLVAKAWFGCLLGTLTLPVVNLFMPSARGKLGGLFDPIITAMEHPITLFAGGIIGTCFWYFIWFSAIRWLDQRADAVTDRVLDAAEDKLHKQEED